MQINFGGSFNPTMDINVQQNFQQIYQICANNHVCENCPVYKQDGLHDGNNMVTICHKVAEKLVKQGKANG